VQPLVKIRTPMSRAEYQLELAAAAEQDFEDILLYTLLTWGQRQMDDYSELLRIPRQTER